MTYSQIISRTQSYLRDFTGSIFRNVDIENYANEGVDRIKQIIPELRIMPYIMDGQPILYLPDYYHHMLAIYSAQRCFAQDENNYRSGVMQNEFEAKLEELKNGIESGEIIIVDGNGDAVDISGVDDGTIDFIIDEYYVDSYTTTVEESEPVM